MLYIFNPSHDDALGAAAPGYNPPRVVRCMERDLALLPAWVAGPQDGVVVPDEAVEAARRFGSVRVVPWSAIPLGESIAPWGWDARLVRRLQAAGVGAERLPGAARLSELRALSSRRFAVPLLAALRRQLPAAGFVGASRWAATMDEVDNTLARWPQVVAKSPWSCSGRGVFGLHRGADDNRSRVAQVLAHFGGVELEPRYRPVLNLAALFEVEPGGSVSYRGLSLFRTAGASYRGNVVAPQAELMAGLARCCPPERYLAAVQALQPLLAARLAGRYVGPLGVDMMVCRLGDDDTPALHPCIEVNLRPTMGRLAMVLAERPDVGAGGRELTLTVLAGRTPEALQAEVARARTASAGRYRPLTPLGPDTLFHACLMA